MSAGNITFYQAGLPPLPAASYTLTADQQASANGSSGSYSAQQAFAIDGPRFRLQPTDVVSTYPPPGTEGQFAIDLPHVVLRSVELPWIRTVGVPTPQPSTPWLAILCLYPASESNLYKGPAATTVGDVAQPPDGVAGPDLGTLTEDEKGQTCMAIDVDTGLFTAIAPTTAELFYLAHARLVDTSAKVAAEPPETGLYSVVVGNRFPDHAPDAPRETLAVLVSLDGIGAYMQPGGVFPDGATWVRLVSLASWTIRASAWTGDFTGLLEAMEHGAGGLGLIGFPHSTAPDETAAQKYAEEALDIGYVPMPQRLRTGETTTTWYRGPLVPYPVETLVLPPYTTSDALERYDPALGLFDVSQSTAWQIGRLLALSDRAFSQSVTQWKRGWQQATANRLTEELLATHMRLAFAAEDEGSRKRRQFDWLRRLLGRFVPRLAGAAPGALPRVTARRERLRDGGLPGIVPPAELEALTTQAHDPVLAVASYALSRRRRA